ETLRAPGRFAFFTGLLLYSREDIEREPNPMPDFLRDLRFAARTLLRSPGFTAIALLTLALGIGANTAIFSVVNAVLLKPIAAPEPERLVAVFQTQPAQGITNNGASYLNYSDWASRATSFEALGAVRLHDYTLTGQGEPTLVIGGGVTGNVFAIYRPKPLFGRTLTPEDDLP